MGRDPGLLTARDGYVLEKLLHDRPPLTDEWFRLLKRKLSLGRLPLAPDGQAELDPAYRIEPDGILKWFYGELLLALGQGWRVEPFWYDWRKGLDLAADQLVARLASWFGPDAPAHLVAHSMGGLVARTFVKKHADRWESLWDRAGNGLRGRRHVDQPFEPDPVSTGEGTGAADLPRSLVT